MMAQMNDDDPCSEAIAALYSPLHQSKTSGALKQAADRRTRTVDDMRTYLNRVDLQVPTHIRVVHVTGTKGKGSTCVMCEAILRERYRQRTGLFTSPHLVNIRERIRVNGSPVSKSVFAQAYFELRKRLERYRDKEDVDGLPVLPGYFRMLTLMAFYIFVNLDPSIDVIILEVGMGGRYDATNLLDLDGTRSVVCGVTLLDYDHVRVLGKMLEQIAWEKGGIFQVKKGTNLTTRPTEDDASSHPVASEGKALDEAALDTRNQFFALGTNTESGLSVLRTCARFEGQGHNLTIVNERQALPSDVQIGLNGPHQRINAEMAIALCCALMNRQEGVSDRGIEAMHHALSTVSWPGRCQTTIVRWPNEQGSMLHLCLDGAHTSISLGVGVSWFQSQCSQKDRPILIFNCSHERNPVPLLQLLLSCRPHFTAVYFCRADYERPSVVGKATAQEILRNAGYNVEPSPETHSGTWQKTLADVWRHLDNMDEPKSTVVAGRTVREALEEIVCQSVGSPKVFITGSLYIVGSALDAVGWTEEEARGTLRHQ